MFSVIKTVLFVLSFSFSLGLALVHGRHPRAVRKPSESMTAKENIPPENSVSVLSLYDAYYILL